MRFPGWLALVLFVLGLSVVQLPIPAGAQTAGTDSTDAASQPAASGVAPSQAQAAALLQLLQDPGARNALIEYLGGKPSGAPGAAPASASDGQAVAPGGAAQSEPAAEGASGDQEPARDATIALRIAELTQKMINEGRGYAEQILRAFTTLPTALSYSSRANWDRIQEIVIQIALIAGSLMVIVWLLRQASDMLFRRLIGDGEGITVLKRALLLLLRGVSEFVVVGIAIGAGYGVAMATGSTHGEVELFESLILNAFFFVQVAKIATRFALSPKFSSLRLVPLDDEQAYYWRFWLFIIYNLLGYGVMVAVPVISRNISFLLADSVRMMIVLAAVLIAIFAVLRNRVATRDRILDYAGRQSNVLASGLIEVMGRIWHAVAIFYVLLLLSVWLSRPFDATAFMVKATAFSVLSVMIGTLVSLMLTRAITDGVHLPENVHQRLPLLERRLNAFVPRVLSIVRFLVFVCVLLGILQAWAAVDVMSWFGSSDGQDWVGRLVSALIVAFIGFLIWLGIMSWVDLRLNPRGRLPTSREKTLFGLFRNAFTILLLVMIALLALSELGVNIGPLIAGAGVFGLAISFGSQKLVQDIITGAFIQFENAMNEGDVVTLGGVTGTVEKLTIRSVRLRDLDGAAHMIPFSTVDRVANFMRGYGYHVAAIGVAYDSDITDVKMAMHVAFDRLKESEAGRDILDPLEMHGVTTFGDSAITVRARIKTLPGSQWATGRAYNEYLKAVFDERGIEIPFPQVTYHVSSPSAEGGERAADTPSLPGDDVLIEAKPASSRSKKDRDIPSEDEL